MARARVWCVLIAASAVLSACGARRPGLVAPEATVAPYESRRGEVLWGVIPLRNESGSSDVDVLALSDAVVSAAQEVEGVAAVPLNRTIEAMRSLKLSSVHTPGEARLLAQRMGVDGILAGTITSWDPYTPRLGLSLALFARPGAMEGEAPAGVDPRALTAAATERVARGSQFADKPVATIAREWDGKNHQVLMDLRQFATGRSDPESALGWARYLKSMGMFGEFAAHEAVAGLVRQEWARTTVRANEKTLAGWAETAGNSPDGGGEEGRR